MKLIEDPTSSRIGVNSIFVDTIVEVTCGDNGMYSSMQEL